MIIIILLIWMTLMINIIIDSRDEEVIIMNWDADHGTIIIENWDDKVII